MWSCKSHNCYIIPYSGLFPWGANFCGSPECHKIFRLRNFPGCLHMLKFGLATFCCGSFCYLCPIGSALGPQGFLFLAVPCVMAEVMNRKRWGQYLLFNVVEPKVASWQPPQQTDLHSCYSHIGILAVLQYSPPNVLVDVVASCIVSQASPNQPQCR